MDKIIDLITPFSQIFTKKGYEEFKVLIQGFILLIGIFSIERIGKLLNKSPKAIREWLSKGRIKIKEIEQILVNTLLNKIDFPLVHGCLPVDVDDTTAEKPYGKKMKGIAKIYNETVDVTIKKEKKRGSLTVLGHCWITVGLMLFNKTFPVICHAHLPENKVKEFGIKKYLTKPEQVLEMLKQINWNHPLLLIGDIAYGCKTLLNSCHNVLSRIRSNGVVYEFPNNDGKKGRGRPKTYGKKHKLKEWWDTVDKEIIVVNGKSYQYFTQIVLLKYCSRPVRLIMAKGEKDKHPWFLFTTLLDMNPEELISWYRYRWGIEVSFKDLKGLMGMADYHLRDWFSIQHYVFFSCISYSILKLWIQLYHPEFSIEDAKLALKQDFVGSRIFSMFSNFIKTDDYSFHIDSIKQLVV